MHDILTVQVEMLHSSDYGNNDSACETEDSSGLGWLSAKGPALRSYKRPRAKPGHMKTQC